MVVAYKSPDSADTRERILQAASELFASQGYAATGLRQIVSQAGVSLAMVNYHFGSKQQLLLSILDRFFDSMIELARRNLPGPGAAEQRLQRHIGDIVEFFRRQPALMRVALLELPRDMPEIISYKADKIRQVVEVASLQLLPALQARGAGRLRLEILGPALIGVIASHFLLRPVIENVFASKFGEEIYRELPGEITRLVLHGVQGTGTGEKNHDQAG